MTNNKNDDYILEDNYHGDIKLTRINKSKKITLTKHNDNIKHNFELDTSNTKSHICLTKPKDLHNSKQINNNITINPKPVQDFNNINNKPSKNITKGISMFLIFIFLMQWFSALGLASIYFILIASILVISTAFKIINTNSKDFSVKLLLKSILNILLSVLLYLMGLSLL